MGLLTIATALLYVLMIGQQTASAATANDHFGTTIREDKDGGTEILAVLAT